MSKGNHSVFKATTVQYGQFKVIIVQYESFWVNRCQNKEKHKLLAESLVPRDNLVPRYWWAKYIAMWACSAWVRTGGRSEYLNSNTLSFTTVQFKPSGFGAINAIHLSCL